MIFAGYYAPPEALTEEGIPLKPAYYWGGAFSMVFPILTAAAVILYYKRINDREMNLIQNGVRGTAEIISCEQTGVYINDLPQIEFTLKISLPGRDAYQVEYKDVVGMLELGAVRKGAKLPAFVDPNKESNVLLYYSSAADSSSIQQ